MTTTPKPRRFPPPWSVEGLDGCFVVKDANGQALAYLISKKRLSPVEARTAHPGRGAAHCRGFRQGARAAAAALFRLKV
jgi:hypothetical protein